MMESLDNVVVTEVTDENIQQLWDSILANMQEASFIAIDAEMSGLGDKSGTMHPNIDQRYTSLCSGARSHSVISLGMACFKMCTNSSNSNDCSANIIKSCVVVYNFVLLCAEPYTIDPTAVKFLIEHGFNFNKQFANGLPYKKGNDKPDYDPKQHSIRSLFSELLCLRKPLVLHNGFTDLIFLYQSFYADCPSKLSAFMADLSEMFPAGIYDTKYITEFVDHASASYLLYVFKLACLKNTDQKKGNKTSLNVEFVEHNNHSVLVSMNCDVKHKAEKSNDVCMKFAAYGWCIKGTACSKSHNTDEIIKFHMQKSGNRKRKNQVESALNETIKKKKEESDLTKCEFQKNNEIEKNDSKGPKTSNSSQGHRSGTDAFMTGYTFAMLVVSHAQQMPEETANPNKIGVYSNAIPFLPQDLQKSIINKLYLSGKNIPLQVCKSSFTKTSKNHTEKIIRVYLS